MDIVGYLQHFAFQKRNYKFLSSLLAENFSFSDNCTSNLRLLTFTVFMIFVLM